MNRSTPQLILLTVLVSLVLITMGGCTESAPSVEPELHVQLYVFGTLVDVHVIADDEAAANRAVSEIESEFQRMHRDLHAWEPGRLVQVNQAIAQHQSARVDEEISYLVERSAQAEEASRGYFNAAIGALIELWGFHTSDYPIIGPPPADNAIDSLLAKSPSAMNIRIRGGSLSSNNSAVQLDFGGIAKGYALDQALAIMEKNGLSNVMVNAGGDLRVLGTKGARPWRVAIRDPAGGVLAVLETTSGEAVFTSGVYERYRESDKQRYPHIIDPRTGRPVVHLSSVTVVSEEGAWSDAASTALTVAGPERWRAIAQSMALEQVLLVLENGTIWVTPKLHERLEYIDQEPGRIKVVPMDGVSAED